MPKINVNSRDNFSSIYGIVDKYADTISQPVNPDSDVVFKNMILTETLTVDGSLTVNGSTTIISADVVEIKDNLIEINSGEQGSGVSRNLSGIKIDRGTLPHYKFVFEESTDTFKIGQVNELQPVATREDNPLAKGIMIFDEDSRLLVSTNTVENDTYFSGSPTVSSTTGAITTDGIGVMGDIFTSGFVNFSNAQNNIHTDGTNLVVSSGTDVILSADNLQLSQNSAVVFAGTSSISTGASPGLYVSSDEKINVVSPEFVITQGTDLVFADNNDVNYQNLSLNGNLLSVFSRVSVGDFSSSFSGESGAVVVSGGVGIGSSENAVSPTNGGALSVSGGVAIGRKLFVGEGVSFTDTLLTHGNVDFRSNLRVATSGSITGSLQEPIAFGISDFILTDDITPSLTSVQNANTGFIGRCTLTASNSGIGITNANTLFIAGPPIGGTNTSVVNYYSLNVNSGDTYLGGDAVISGTTTISGSTTVDNNLSVSGQLSLGSGNVNTEANNQGKFLNITPSDINDAISIGTATEMYFNRISSGTLTSTSVITTDTAATLVIDNEPVAGNNQTILNSYSLLVKQGKTKVNDLYTRDTFVSGEVQIQGNLQVLGDTELSFISSDEFSVNKIDIQNLFTSNGILDLTTSDSLLATFTDDFVKVSLFKTPDIINPQDYPIQNTATVYIEGPTSYTPTGEKYSLYVQEGLSRFSSVSASLLDVSGPTTLTDTLQVNVGSSQFNISGNQTSIVGSGSTVIVGSGVIINSENPFSVNTFSGISLTTDSGFTLFSQNSSTIQTFTGPLFITGGGKVSIDSNTSIEIGKSGASGIDVLIGDLASNTIIGNNLVVQGNFAVTGETVTLNSSTLSTDNNSIIVNSMPFGVSDGGLLVRRFQVPNDAGEGQVVADINPRTGAFTQNSTGNSLFLVSGSYVGWWIKITSGSGSGQVRRIKSYGIATNTTEIHGNDSNDANFNDGLDLTTQVLSGDTYSLYPGTFAGMFFNDTDNTWVLGKVPVDNNAGKFPAPDLADLHVNYATVSSALTITNSSSNNSGSQDLLSIVSAVASQKILQVLPNNVVIGGPVGDMKLTFSSQNTEYSKIITSRDADNVNFSTMRLQIMDGASLSDRLIIDKTGATCSGNLKILGFEPNTSTSTGALVVGGGVGISDRLTIGGDVNIINKNLVFSNDGVNPPTLVTRSSGTKIVIRSSISSLLVDYALGISDASLWYSVPGPANNHRFYNGTTNTMTLSGNTLSISPTTVSNSSSTGALVVGGGVGIGGALNVTGTTRLTNNTASTSTFTGALTVSGGVGIIGSMYVGGTTRITDPTTSTSINTGALVVSGGLGVSFSIHCGRLFTMHSNIGIGTSSTDHSLTIDSTDATVGPNADNSKLTLSGSTGKTASNGATVVLHGNSDTLGGRLELSAGNVANTGSITLYTGGLERCRIDQSGTFSILSGIASNLSTTGALVVSGGVGVSGDINVTGDISISGQITSAEWAGQTITVPQGGTGSTSYGFNSLLVGKGVDPVVSFANLTYNVDTLSLPKITSTDTSASTSSTSGPITFAGGVSVAKNVYIGTDLYTTGNIGIGTDTNVNSELTLVRNSNIGVDTLGGADTGFLSISGGGSALASRGGNIVLYGNESATNSGNVHIDTSTSILLKTSGNTRILVDNTGKVSFPVNTPSTSSTTGAVVVSGGIGVSNTTNSTSSTDGGSFTTAGGAAVQKDLYVGGDITVSGDIFTNSITVVPFTNEQADVVISQNIDTVSLTSGKFIKLYGEREIRGVFMVAPSTQYATCIFNFIAPESTFNTPFEAVPSTQGFADGVSVENLISQSIPNNPALTGRISIRFTSNSTALHTIQFIVKY